MKQFTMSMFASRQDLLEAKCSYLESLLAEHKKVFEWVMNNYGCHPGNIYYEIEKLLKELKE